MHDWLGEVIAQPLIQTPCGLFLNLILSEKKKKKTYIEMFYRIILTQLNHAQVVAWGSFLS